MIAVLIQIVIALVVVALLFWVLQQLNVDAQIQKIVRVVLVVLFVIWFIYLIVGFLPAGSVPHAR